MNKSLSIGGTVIGAALLTTRFALRSTELDGEKIIERMPVTALIWPLDEASQR